MPKFNLYQSLHTTVVGPSGKAVEVQIRTQEMHRRAEYGIAAHWGYKEREPADDLLWLQRMVDWQQETSDPGEFMESLKIDLEYDEVFVFTPKGKVITLATGATPGRLRVRDPHRRRPPVHRRARQRAARAARLRRSRRATPSRSSPARSRARARAATGCSSCTRRRRSTKIRQWFSRERRVDAIDTGREELAKALRKEGLPVQKLASSTSLHDVADALHYADLDALHAAIGESHVSAKAVVQRLQKELRGGEEQLPVTAARPPSAPARSRAPRHRRARRGPRRRDGAALALLHPGARRRDHGLRHPRPRRVGAPHRLRQRRRPRRPRASASSRSSGTTTSPPRSWCRSRSRRSTARSCSATSPTCSPSTTSTSCRCTSQTSSDRVAKFRFDFELADPNHLESILWAVKRVDSVYAAYRVLPGHAKLPPTNGSAIHERREDLRAQLRAATELLEAVAADPSVLEVLTEKERIRLRQRGRRRLLPRRRGAPPAGAGPASAGERAEKLQRDEDVLAETGIRRLRAKPVFTTPERVPARGLRADDVTAPATVTRATADRSTATSARRSTRRSTTSTTSSARRAPSSTSRKRTEIGRPPRPRRAAHRRPGEDRLPGRASSCCAPARRSSSPPASRATRRCATPREPDFDDWGDRLEIFGLDLRHTPSVEAFCRHLDATRDRLDFIVNNACQTVRRPPDFYRHMMDVETASLATMPGAGARAARRVRRPARLRPGGDGHRRSLDRPGADRRPDARGRAVAGAAAARRRPPQATCSRRAGSTRTCSRSTCATANSWRLTLAEVSSVELLETQLVNAVAPFVLNARLKPLMLRTPERDKHIVNVSAVEGQFYRRFKTTKHPHTNMAKAALNMMTRTSAADYHADGIHMNSVDTGWVSDEDPVADRRARRPRSTASTRRSTSSTAPRASSIRSSPASTPASTSTGSSSRTTTHRLVTPDW